jgi:transposase
MAKKRRRRIWEDEEKRRIVAQARVPGVSVSQVARRYDVNANMVFKWLRDPRFMPSADDLPSFLPVEVLPDASLAAAMSDVQPALRPAAASRQSPSASRIDRGKSLSTA